MYDPLDTAKSSFSALLLAGVLALSALPAPVLSEEAVPGEAVTLQGNDAGTVAATADREAAGNGASADSDEGRLTSEVVPPT